MAGFGSILAFLFTAFAMGVGFLLVFEEVFSTNRERVRFNIVVGLPLAAMFVLMFLSVLGHYRIDHGLMIVVKFVMLSVVAFVSGVGCMMGLRSWQEGLLRGNDRRVFHMLMYVCAGVAIPALVVASIVIGIRVQ